MEKFSKTIGIAIPMERSNIDTGALAPSLWLRDHPADFAGGLFFDWRYKEDGTPDPNFILNQDRYKDASILVAGPNFGCGSSREAAVWALMQYGFRVVIAPSFGEIFRDNGFQNGLLTILLDAGTVERISRRLTFSNDPTVSVDLENQTIVIPGEPDPIPFQIAPDRKAALLAGLDETMQIAQSRDKIRAFEDRDQSARPWIYGYGSLSARLHTIAEIEPTVLPDQSKEFRP